ncbi:MAG: hypothetical protein K1X82_03325 [Bacteroidia bacterium]|nr:hypothetical protein [Bacteroidia bacterium]
MKRIFLISLLGGLLISLSTLKSFQCSNARGIQAELFPPINPEFAEYIQAFTAGTISTKSSIKIIMSADVGLPVELNTAVENEYFEFEPNISGKVVWTDAKTIEFKPDQKLASNQIYKASFKLEKLLPVKDELKQFNFAFKTIKQDIQIEIENVLGHSATEEGLVGMQGSVVTADAIDGQLLEKIFTFKSQKSGLVPLWVHSADQRSHSFSVDSIHRGQSDSEVLIQYDGSSIGIDKSDELKIEIPSINTFQVTKVRTVNAGEQYVSVQFSDYLPEQFLPQGLVELEGLSDIKYYHNANEVRLYTSSKITGSYTLKVLGDVSNAHGKKLGKTYTASVSFANNSPAVKILGNGTILPDGKGLIIPFEAINLKAVDVKIVKIFENNMTQFLQTNSIGDNGELGRVGKVVRKKTILLSNSNSPTNDWKQYGLDISKLVKTEPGAIYRVSLSFKKSYGICNCPGVSNSPIELEEMHADQEESQGPTRWGYYYDYSENDYEEGEGYEWSQRDNPCNIAYYREARAQTRNILASNFGIIAKKGNDNTYLIAVSNLNTAQPLSGITVELYDYQKQLIHTGITNDEGLVLTTLKNPAFIIVAKKGAERGYLKVDEWSNQQLGMFDIGGETVQKGIKAFIYGERGVWRPGDSLFLNLILEDKQKRLPEHLPVIMELFTPQGQLFKRLVKANPLNGFYTFKVVTDKGSPTGNWTANFKVGSTSFSKTLKIETVMPNRLKINLDPGVEKFTSNMNSQEIKLNSKWLHGAPARNLKADVAVSFGKIPTEFKSFKGYTFENSNKSIEGEESILFDGRLDANGNTNFTLSLDNEAKGNGMARIYFKTRVYEEGGNFSIDKYSIDYSPYSHYAGFIKPGDALQPKPLITGKEQTIKVVSVNEQGLGTSGRKMNLVLKKLSWRWWWDNEDGDYDYESYEYGTETINLEETTGKDGLCQFIVKIKDNDWGRYKLEVTDVESGHTASSEIWFDWENWWTRQGDGGKAPSTINFSCDKEVYEPGSDIKLSIPGMENSKALISLESGSRVIKAFWVNLNKGQNEVKFKASPEMAPNIYAYVTLVQPFNQTINDLPIRQYGVIPIRIEDLKTHLKPVISMADVVEPESKATVQVKEANGKAMTYTLAIVDDGLLDLTRFKTPDPWSHFYAREALGVRTWDLFDQVIGAWAGEIETVLGIGGDEGLNGKEGSKANRFKPMVKFLGPFYLEGGKTQTHSIAIPAYVGSARVMVIAGQDGAYGFGEKTVTVRKPLMVLATLPRVLGPEETVKLPVTVFAMEKSVKDVTLQVKVGNKVSVVSSSVQNLHFNEVGDQVATFELKVNNTTGVTKIGVLASSGKHQAKDEIEIEIRNPNLPETRVVNELVEPGKSITLDYAAFGSLGTNKGSIEVSSVQNFGLEKRLEQLIVYPHGCIEQTTSSVFPQLFLSKVMDLSPELKADIDNNIKHGIDRIKGFQTTSGGLSYWPGEQYADTWGTNYGGHFMLEAEAKGYSLPSGWKSKWIEFQKTTALSWKPYNYHHGYYFYDDDLIQAYRLYTLALAKAPVLSAMNRLREKSNLSFQARWRLAAAYALSGQKEIASKLIANQPTTVKFYRELDYSFGSNTRDEAMILETLTLLGQKNLSLALVQRLAKEMTNDSYCSTQTTAYTLIALSKFFGSSSQKGVSGNLIINGVNQTFKSTSVSYKQDLKMDQKAKGKIQIKNDSKGGPLFVQLTISGRPSFQQTKDYSSNMNMNVRYTDLKGNPISVSKLEQGTDFIAEVTIANPISSLDLRQLALSQVFASGWEIRNVRMEDNSNLGKQLSNSSFTYQDIRDDRVYTYFNLDRNQTKVFRIQLNAAYLGRFFYSGPSCETMYDNNYSARKAGTWVEVVQEVPPS